MTTLEIVTPFEAALNRRTGKYSVKLSNVGNPDYRQDSHRPLPDTVCGVAHVETMAEAAALCRNYIEFYELGGGNWNGGELTCENVVIGRVSYNGHIWDNNQFEIIP